MSMTVNRQQSINSMFNSLSPVLMPNSIPRAWRTLTISLAKTLSQAMDMPKAPIISTNCITRLGGLLELRIKNRKTQSTIAVWRFIVETTNLILLLPETKLGINTIWLYILNVCLWTLDKHNEANIQENKRLGVWLKHSVPSIQTTVRAGGHSVVVVSSGSSSQEEPC